MLLDSLLCWTVAFGILPPILLRTVSQPPKIAEMTNPVEKDKAFWYHVTNASSMIHALVTFIASIVLINQQGLQYAGKNTEEQNALCVFSLAYYIVDTIYGEWKRYNNRDTLIHHMIALTSLSYILVKDQYAANCVWGYIIGEITNPIYISARTVEQYHGTETLFKYLSLAFCTLFLYVRCYVAKFYIQEMQKTSACLILKLQSGFICEITRALVDVLELDDRQQAHQRVVSSSCQTSASSERRVRLESKVAQKSILLLPVARTFRVYQLSQDIHFLESRRAVLSRGLRRCENRNLRTVS